VTRREIGDGRVENAAVKPNRRSWGEGKAIRGWVHHSDNYELGGFNWWSQHLGMMEVSDGSACWVDEGVDGSFADEVAWCAVDAAGGGAGVLA
jgi:hypothetical protein